MAGPSPPRRGRWLVAGGLAGLALSWPAGRLRTLWRTRAPGPASDPVSAFRAAPCYEHDRAAAAAPDRTGQAG